MSASREKNKRKEQTASPEAVKETKKGMSKGLKTTLGVICAVLVVCIVVFFYMLTSGYFTSHSTAATVGSHDLSPAMVDHFYRGAYNDMQNQYGSLMSYIIDSNTPLDEQFYDEEAGTTWADYFIEQGLNTAAETYAIYDAAIADGYTLSDEDQQTIDTQISQIALYASASGFSTDTYIAYMYGTGCNEKTLREYLKVVTVASNYASQTANAFEYSDEQIDAEYNANVDKYDGVTYRTFSVTDSMFQTAVDETGAEEAEADGAEDTEQLSDEELAALKEEMASKMAADAEGDEQAFIDAAYENAADASKETYEDESATLREDALYSSVSDTASADWLFDAERKEGDTTYIAADSGVYYVLYFISRSTNDYQLPNVRHILISVSDTTDETAMDEARTKAEQILTEFDAGEHTGEAFGELAREYTDDSNGDEGGLYTNITPGQMVTEFNDWCFDESRKPGDTGIIETSYGVHVMYFDGYGDTYRHVMAENTLRTNDYNAWHASIVGEETEGRYTLVPFGMKFVTK